MPTLFTDPVNITPSTGTSWVDADVSAYCPAGATGVILEFVNNTIAKSVGWRKKGSTDDRATGMPASAHIFGFCGVDDNRVLQLYVSSISAVTVYLHGYFDKEAYFFTNAPEITPGTTGSWQDVDISANLVAGDSAVAAFVEFRNTSLSVGLRPNGSSDNSQVGCTYDRGGVVGVDANDIFECYLGGADTDVWLNGYLKYGAVFDITESEVTPTTGETWVDLAALPSGAIGGIYRLYGASTVANDKSAVRCNGSTVTKQGTYGDTNRHIWGIVKCDANRIVEGYIAPIVGRSGTNQAGTPIALTSDVGAVLPALGGASDKWGLSLTPAQVKASSFGVVLGFIATADDADLYVDYVTLKVTYTPSGGPQTATAAKFPTVGVDDSSFPWSYIIFTNAGYIVADDTNYAKATGSTFDTGKRTRALFASGFDFSAIPDDATIDGVECVVSAWYANGTVSMDLCQLIDTTPSSAGRIFQIGYVVDPPTPVVTGLSVSSGAVGDPIVITGTGFFRTQMSGLVEFNGTSATITSWSDTEIVCTVPVGATTGSVVVTNDYGNSSVGELFVLDPIVSSATPDSGAEGDTITIAGYHFGADQGSVTVGGVPATITSWTDTEIVITVPAGVTAGATTIVVSDDSGYPSNALAFTATSGATDPDAWKYYPVYRAYQINSGAIPDVTGMRIIKGKVIGTGDADAYKGTPIVRTVDIGSGDVSAHFGAEMARIYVIGDGDSEGYEGQETVGLYTVI